mgnify:CR=1 FL=1
MSNMVDTSETGRPSVLVVDDEDNISFLVSSALRLAEIDVVTASNGRDAVTLAASARPDAVVLDLHLREGNGIDVMRALRQVGTLPTFIVLTNHSGLPYRKAALEAGADHFLDKSTEIPLVLSLIRTLQRGARTTK